MLSSLRKLRLFEGSAPSVHQWQESVRRTPPVGVKFYHHVDSVWLRRKLESDKFCQLAPRRLRKRDPLFSTSYKRRHARMRQMRRVRQGASADCADASTARPGQVKFPRAIGGSRIARRPGTKTKRARRGKIVGASAGSCTMNPGELFPGPAGRHYHPDHYLEAIHAYR